MLLSSINLTFKLQNSEQIVYTNSKSHSQNVTHYFLLWSMQPTLEMFVSQTNKTQGFLLDNTKTFNLMKLQMINEIRPFPHILGKNTWPALLQILFEKSRQRYTG